jgi:LemA protein
MNRFLSTLRISTRQAVIHPRAPATIHSFDGLLERCAHSDRPGDVRVASDSKATTHGRLTGRSSTHSECAAMLFLLFVLVGGGVLLVMKQYNSLQGLAQGVREAHSNIMASMKKRIDLANKLMDIARGYADHEKLTHISVANGGDVISVGGSAAAGALNQVMKLATQFPDLKANSAYQQLMAQLDQIEADLQVKREAYNGQVRVYNTALVRLPMSLYAGQLGFRSAPYFDVDNADSLEKLRDFHSDDAEHLKQMLAQGGRRIADGSRKLADGGMKVAGESVRIGKIAVDRGVEMGIEMQKRHAAAAAAAAEGASSEAAPPLPPVAPEPAPEDGDISR